MDSLTLIDTLIFEAQRLQCFPLLQFPLQDSARKRNSSQWLLILLSNTPWYVRQILCNVESKELAKLLTPSWCCLAVCCIDLQQRLAPAQKSRHIHLYTPTGGVMMGVSWRVGGRGEFSTCNTTLQASRGRLSLCPSLWWTPGLTRGCVFFVCCSRWSRRKHRHHCQRQQRWAQLYRTSG